MIFRRRTMSDSCVFRLLGAPSYGGDFLRMVSSVYPGFHDTRTAGEVIVGMVYGLADGAIAGGVH